MSEGAAPDRGTPASATPGDRRTLRLRREAWGFAIGSLCFLAGALPFYAAWAGAVGAGVTFFVGSLFFTAAGFIQLSLSGRRPPRAKTNRADRSDWWSAAVQFVGTLFFNLSTGAALAAAIAAPDVIGAGWRPDAYGSLAFLVSSALAVVAARHRLALWDREARHLARHLAEHARVDRLRRVGGRGVRGAADRRLRERVLGEPRHDPRCHVLLHGCRAVSSPGPAAGPASAEKQSLTGGRPDPDQGSPWRTCEAQSAWRSGLRLIETSGEIRLDLGQSRPSTMRKSRSKPSGSSASAFW